MKKIYLLIATALVLSGCSIFNREGKTKSGQEHLVPGHSVQSVTEHTTLLNGDWSILEVKVHRVVMPDEIDDTPQITFNIKEDGVGQLYCYTGCNYINGTVAISPNGAIASYNDFMSTLMACSDEGMAVETAINQTFIEMRSYRIEHIDSSYFLYLLDAQGQTLLTARRWDINFLNGAWSVTQIGDKTINEEDGIQLVLDIPEERVHGNTGCNILNGTLKLSNGNVNGIEFTNIAVTRRGCPDPVLALERDLLVAMEDVASCEASSGVDNAVLKDSTGKVLIKLSRLVLQHD